MSVGPVIAHRGFSSRAPENTAAAFEAAIAVGCDMIELDARLTGDGGVAVVHDDDLRRYGHRGRVSELPLDRLRELDAGSWLGAGFAGERFLSLGEALAVIGGRVAVNVELKLEEGDRRTAERLVSAVLEELGPAAGGARSDRGAGPRAETPAVAATSPRTLLSSFSSVVLDQLRTRAADLPRAALVGFAADAVRTAWPRPFSLLARLVDELIPRLSDAGAEGLHAHRRLAHPEVIDAAHATGLAVRIYTVNEPDEMRRLLDWGVDGIFTDQAGRLLDVVRGRPVP